MDEFRKSRTGEASSDDYGRTPLVTGFTPETPDETGGGEIRHMLNPKLVFGSILFFGVFTLIYGGFKIWKDIQSPSLAQEQSRQTLQQQIANTQLSAPTDAELRERDTDGDGLNDWDELNRYGTSPYLKDSDGDSYSDKTEIDSKNDPNCPRGQNCRVGAFTPPATTSPQSFFSELLPPAPEAQATPPPDLANMTPQQLRDLLLKTGEVTKEQLDQIDDAALMQMYRETLSQQQQQVQQP